MKIYIATSWYNRDEFRRAVSMLPPGWEITCDWTDEDEDSDPAWISERDLRGVREADLLMLILPGRLGAHTEMGYALGLGKHVLLVGERWPDGKSFPDSPFYFDPRVHVESSLAGAMMWLQQYRSRFER
jgi:hypothetical protein